MKRFFLIPAAMIVTLFSLNPPDAIGEPVAFTLEEIYLRSLEMAEEIKISREEVRHAREEKNRARSTILPLLKITGEYDRSPEETGGVGGTLLQPKDSYEARITLEQPLYAGGKNWAAYRQSKKAIEAAQKDLDLSQEALLLKTAETFYNVLMAEKNLDAQQRNVERLREHRRLSELRYKVGEVTESILLRAEAELSGAEAELAKLENDLAVRKRALQILAGLPDGFRVEEPPLPEVPGPSASSLKAVALDNRNDILKSRIEEEISREQVNFSRGNFFPTLSLEGSYFYRGQDPESFFLIEDSWAIGARFEFPIFEGGLRVAEMAQARSRSAQDRFETEKLMKDIDVEVTRASLTLEGVSRELESRLKQVRFAAKNYEMVSKQYTFGLATNIDVLDANQTLIDAERDTITTTYEKHLAILDLQRSVGLFLPRVLKRVQTQM